jgi:hypothetical protein
MFFEAANVSKREWLNNHSSLGRNGFRIGLRGK